MLKLTRGVFVMFKKIKFSPHPFSKKVLFWGLYTGLTTEIFATAFGFLFYFFDGRLNRLICQELLNTGLRFIVITLILFAIFEVLLKPNK